MADKSNARKWAHGMMAQMLAEQVRLVRDNEADLVEFGKQQGRLVRAEKRRATAIAAANARFEEVETEAEAGAGAALARLHHRGVSESQLCAMTGLASGRVRRLLHDAARRDPDAGTRIEAQGLPAGVGFVVDECGTGDQPPQAGQPEDAQGDRRGPRAVFERPSPVTSEPDDDPEDEPR